ncbi:SAM-dependent methyltransferase [Sphaerisporangium sp. TRM90804]|uniref:SAM-dependent methyltransferase n=1 Tax=Sphaerisporangium sp. TRM90804 TaxID=3031113 RepID=UPI0024474D72|nr:SAM-dependent methyltransferase [Sphaerisporangium sp. TRM90804]MDH2429171.1 SAM-dependent methyltransferase [Sphaerisporangium sp. TRM90804]
MGEFEVPAGVDPYTPSVARMYDYYLGGKDNFAADREAAEKIIELLPNVREIARENREFLIRAVTYLCEQGVRQFLDVGAGLPTQRNVHQVAQDLAPESRVVYVDNDPIVMTHARALLAENARVIAVAADMRDTQALLDRAEIHEHLDFSEPVAVLLLGVLHFIPDDDEALKIVTALRAPLVPGSHLAVSHGSIDTVDKDRDRKGQQIFSRTSVPGTTSRNPAQLAAFLDGLEIADPGIVSLSEWRPEINLALPTPGGVGAIGAVARVI